LGTYIRASAHAKTPVAAIDIGSNSIHMVIACLDRGGHLEILDSEKLSTRLGAYLSPEGLLSREGEAKAIQAVTYMCDIALSYGASIRAVATHALREATNHATVVEAIRRKTGVTVEIIDGQEEARLVFLGMRYALPIERQSCLGMDIGGGSTEFIVAKGDKVAFSSSLKIGAVTLTAQHFGEKGPKIPRIKALNDYINLRLNPLSADAKKHKFTKAIASSGTAKALAVIHARLFNSRSLNDENGYVMPSYELNAIVTAIEELREPKLIREAFGVDSARSDILLAGAAIMRQATKVFGVTEWTFTTFGLREGVVIDTFRRMGSERLGRAKDVRWESVTEQGLVWSVDEGQAKKVTDLSLQIFSKISPLAYQDSKQPSWMADRDILRAASWLHESGKFISTTAYHKHSYYLIKHSRMAGFTQDERQMIGLVVLYHRKSSPRFHENELQDVRQEEFRRVQFLSGILRMSAALNRSRRGAVESVRVSKVRSLHFKIKVKKGLDPSVELQQLEREREHLEKAFGWHFILDSTKLALRGRAPRRASRKK
jgi:exopolyphosphatase/guanosine-5'-triphosphate,3'-diphosphate pyrophosphatase